MTNFLLSPWLVLFWLSLITIKWIYRVFVGRQPRHIFTLVSRVYMLIVYGIIAFMNLDIASRAILVRLGIGLWAFDEAANWIIPAIIEWYKRRKIIKALRSKYL